MTSNAHRIEMLVMRIQRAFLDTPALSLNFAQAQQRFGADPAVCEAVLGALVDANVLTRSSDGGYRRFFPHLADAA
jgi:hypothetical protein